MILFIPKRELFIKFLEKKSFLLTEYFEEKEKEDSLLNSVRIYWYQQVYGRFYHVGLLYDVDVLFVHPEEDNIGMDLLKEYLL